MLDSKTEIMRVAIDLFAKSGYHVTSIRDIAKHAHVNSSMVSYYYKSKENLYNEIFRNLYIDLDRLCKSKTETENIENDFSVFITELLEFCLSNSNRLLILMIEQISATNDSIIETIENIKNVIYLRFKNLYHLKGNEDSDVMFDWKFVTLTSHIKSLIIYNSMNTEDNNLSNTMQSIKNIELSLKILFNTTYSIILKQVK